MVDNKSKTSLTGHIHQKYITHEDSQFNIRAGHSYNIVIFILDIFFLYVIWEVLLFYVITFIRRAVRDHKPPPRSNIKNIA